MDRNFSHGDIPGAPVAADVPQPALWHEDTRPTIIPLGMAYDGGLEAAMTQDVNALDQVVLVSPDNKEPEANATGDAPANPSESPDGDDKIAPLGVTQPAERVGAELIRHVGGIVGSADGSDDKTEGVTAQSYAEGSVAEAKEVPSQELSPCQRVIEAVRTDTTFKERHPNAPDVEVVFRFDPHHSAADFKQLPKALEGAHVYLYEAVGFNQDSFLQMVADQPPMPIDELIEQVQIGDDNRPVRGTTSEQMFRGLHDSRIAVGTMDLSTDPDAVSLTQYFQNSPKPPAPQDVATLEEAVAQHGAMKREHVERQAEREIYIAKEFEPKIARLLAQRPELASHEKLKVVATLGPLHSNMVEVFHARGITASGNDVPNDDIISRVEWRLKNGEPVSEEEIKQDYMAALLVNDLYGVLDEKVGIANTDEFSAYLGSIISSLSDDDMNTIFTHSRDNTKVSPFYAFLSVFAKGGYGTKDLPAHYRQFVANVNRK